MNKDRLAAAAATIAVVVVLVFGLRALGGHQNQRQIQADLQTLRRLSEVAQRIQATWLESGKELPANLDRFPATMKQDPFTSKPYVYRPKSGSEYELCATFLSDTRNLQAANPDDHWAHPKGDYCFELNAALPMPPIPYFY
jgi:hypothetical protein